MTAAGRVERIRAVRASLPDRAAGAGRGPGDFERVALPAGDADVLRDLVAVEAAAVVVEVGLAYGASALAIAEALAGRPGARHLLLDAYQDRFGEVGWDAIVAAGADGQCELVRERSQLALARLAGAGFVADLAFVDGGHRFHDVFVDLAFLRGIVRPGGLVVLDDCEWPSVATAVDYFVRNTGWREVPVGATRLRGFRLPDPPVEPRFEDFVPFG